jgi:fumarate hydratase class I
VFEYAEMGMEAIWKMEFENFPAFIAFGQQGNDFFAQIGKGGCNACAPTPTPSIPAAR